MVFSITIVRKFNQAYSAVCKPLCRELELPQTAFDILMFLGNNPAYKTAGEIVELRHIKANLVSVYVDRLVREGYLLRKPVAGDRRKTELVPTEQAEPVIQKGRALQERFVEILFRDMELAQRRAFFAALQKMEANLDGILEEMR